MAGTSREGGAGSVPQEEHDFRRRVGEFYDASKNLTHTSITDVDL